MRDSSVVLVALVGVVAIAIVVVALRSPLPGMLSPAKEDWQVSYDSSGNIRGLTTSRLSR